MICPKCCSSDLRVNTYQDTARSISVSSRSGETNKQNHSCIWWITCGWWWELTKFTARVTFFFPRLILRLISAPFKNNKQPEKSSSIRSSIYNPKYITAYTCKKCGYRWTMH